MNRWKPCARAGCGELAPLGMRYCDKHGGNANWQNKENINGHQYGHAWRRARNVAMKRDCYVCQPCGRHGKLTPATEVDHIIPVSQGGTDKLANLQAICHECHTKKTQHEGGGARKYGKA